MGEVVLPLWDNTGHDLLYCVFWAAMAVLQEEGRFRACRVYGAGNLFHYGGTFIFLLYWQEFPAYDDGKLFFHSAFN